MRELPLLCATFLLLIQLSEMLEMAAITIIMQFTCAFSATHCVPMLPLGLKETNEVDFKSPIEVGVFDLAGMSLQTNQFSLSRDMSQNTRSTYKTLKTFFLCSVLFRSTSISITTSQDCFIRKRLRS